MKLLVYIHMARSQMRQKDRFFCNVKTMGKNDFIRPTFFICVFWAPSWEFAIYWMQLPLRCWTKGRSRSIFLRLWCWAVSNSKQTIRCSQSTWTRTINVGQWQTVAVAFTKTNNNKLNKQFMWQFEILKIKYVHQPVQQISSDWQDWPQWKIHHDCHQRSAPIEKFFLL